MAGEGPTLLLIHGMAGSSQTWRSVMPRLSEEFRVLAPDLLGHGESATPPGDYSLGGFASLLRDLLGALDIDHATIVGQSLGGGVAMQLAYQYPELAERLVLVSSGGLGREVSWLLRALALPGTEYVMPVAFPGFVREVGDRIAGVVESLGWRAPRVAEMWKAYSSLTSVEHRAAFVRTLRAVIDPGGQAINATNRLYLAAALPTLIVWGDQDPIIPVSHAIAAHDAIPGSRLEIFEGVGHFPTWSGRTASRGHCLTSFARNPSWFREVPMRRLSGLDAAFLALETPAAHMHVIGVAVVDPATAPTPFSHRAIQRLLEARMHLVPAFRRRLVEVPFGLQVPVWIEDPDFELTYHLRRTALPAPGSMLELAEFVAEVAGRPLDRRKPLWEAYVVEGLEHGYHAFVVKLHHSLIDGASGVEILTTLFDLAADTPAAPPDTTDEWQPDHVPSEIEMIGRAAREVIGQPARLLRAANGLVRSLTRIVRRDPGQPIHITLPLATPRLSMNRTISPRRAVALTSVPLAEVRAVKSALGVTVNDVVLAVTAGALRSYLVERDELPEHPLVAAIPTSVRPPGDHMPGNQVSAMFAALPVELADPVARVRVIQESTAGAKSIHELVGGTTLQEWAELAAPVLFSRCDSHVRAAAHRREAPTRDQRDRVERPGTDVPAVPGRCPARRAAPVGPRLRRLRAEPDGDLLSRSGRVRIPRLSRARARHRAARGCDPRGTRRAGQGRSRGTGHGRPHRGVVLNAPTIGSGHTLRVRCAP